MSATKVKEDLLRTTEEKQLLLGFRELDAERKKEFLRFMERVAAGDDMATAAEDLFVAAGQTPEVARELVAKALSRAGQKESRP